MPNASAVRTPAMPPRPKLIEFRRTQETLERTAYQARIDHYGTNPFMKWTLTYFQHMMVHQDGPRVGQFIPPAWFHQDMTALLEGKLTSKLPMPRLASLLARDQAKSSYGTVVFVIRAAAEHNKKNIVIVCAGRDEAKARIATIITEINYNERLKQHYPGLALAKDSKNQWVTNTDYEIHLTNGTVILACAVGAKLRGRMINFKRIDLYVFDDPEHEDFEYSEILRTKFARWLQSVVLRGMTRYCPLAWQATPVGATSQLIQARNSPDDEDAPGFKWKGQHVPIAVELDGKGHEIPWSEDPPLIPFKPTPTDEVELLFAENESAATRLVAHEELEAAKWWKPNWAARFSPLDVARMMNEGDAAVAQQELMLRPVSRKSNPFDVGAPAEYAYTASKIKRPRRGVVTYKNRRLGPVFAHIDSAESTEPTADYTCIPWGAKDPKTKKVLLLGMFYGRIEVADQLALLQELNEYWGFRKIGHEKSMLERAIQSFAKRQSALPLDEVETLNQAGAKERRLRADAGIYKNAIVIFPSDKLITTNDPKLAGKTIIEIVKGEMKRFPGGKKDALDAIDHMVTRALDSGGSDSPPDPQGVVQLESATKQLLDVSW